MLNSRDIGLLRADVAANCRRMIELAKADGWPILVTGTVRDAEYQLYCYNNGTSKSKVATFHSVSAGLAFDICKNVKGQEYSDAAFWAYVGALGKRMGFTWGGDWTSIVDKPHFQWDANKQYGNSDILAGRYPPDMPLYGESEEDDMAKLTDEEIYNAVVRHAKTLTTDAYAKDSSKKAVESGYFSDGDGDQLVDIPQGYVKRQELAVVLDRMGLLG